MGVWTDFCIETKYYKLLLTKHCSEVSAPSNANIHDTQKIKMSKNNDLAYWKKKKNVIWYSFWSRLMIASMNTN